MPRVTVIIPSYNHEKFVAEAIQSVLDQTYQDFEIVITDDGSTDKSVNIITSFTDPRIKVFCFEQNQGACVAANKCVSEAKGEYIAMLSSDDIFAPDKLEKQVGFLDENPEIGAVFSYAQIIDEEGNDFTDENHPYKHIFIQNNRTRFNWLTDFFFVGNFLCHPSVLIRKQCYDQIGLYDERYAQLPDFDFWIRLCMKYEIHILPENLIKFRVLKNELNASGNRPETRSRKYLEKIQILNNYLSDDIYDNFLKIFTLKMLPARFYRSDIETVLKKEHMPFLIGVLALEVHDLSSRYFGINTIFEILSDKNVAQSIRDIYSFSFKDFIDLTGKIDVFNTVMLEKLQFLLKQLVQPELK